MKFFDLHCDTATEGRRRQVSLNDETLAVRTCYAGCFEQWRQTYAVWIRDDAPDPFALYQSVIEDCKRKLKEEPRGPEPVFAVEGGALIENDLSRLERLRRDGIRFLTLTWNGANRIAGGCHTSAGLTRFGKRVIAEMNRLHIACDLSHLNRKSFFAAAEAADTVLATHSNCAAVFDCPRNLTDDQLKLIAGKGGLVGITFFPAFLGGDVFEKIYANIAHLLDLGMERNIGIGSDFDGADMDTRLCCTGDIPSLYMYLSEKGLRDRTLDRIFYENADNFLKRL